MHSKNYRTFLEQASRRLYKNETLSCFNETLFFTSTAAPMLSLSGPRLVKIITFSGFFLHTWGENISSWSICTIGNYYHLDNGLHHIVWNWYHYNHIRLYLNTIVFWYRYHSSHCKLSSLTSLKSLQDEKKKMFPINIINK